MTFGTKKKKPVTVTIFSCFYNQVWEGFLKEPVRFKHTCLSTSLKKAASEVS